MTAPSEQDPTRGIVDIDTFGAWVEDHRKALLEDRNTQRNLIEVPVELKGDYLLVNNYPWPEVPKDIQDIIGQHYASVATPDDKTISISFEEETLEFKLHAPTIMEKATYQFDIVGETFLSHGTRLHFSHKMADEVASLPSLKGSWITDRTSAALKIRSRSIFDQLKRGETLSPQDYDILMDVWDYSVLPARLNQLHSVANLLVRAKPFTRIARFISVLRN